MGLKGLTRVAKVLEGDVPNVAATAPRHRFSVVRAAKDLDTGTILGVQHGDVPDVEVRNDVG